jgi:hypothetical protein
MSKHGRRKRHEPHVHVNKYQSHSRAESVAAQLAFEAEKQRRGLPNREEQQIQEIESRLAEEQRQARIYSRINPHESYGGRETSREYLSRLRREIKY